MRLIARPVVDRRARAGPPRARAPGCAAAGSSSRRTPRAAASRSPAPPASGSPTAASAPPRSRTSARAERRAMSSQIGSPDGASALCGSVSPNASATTCDVAAVPRNWQPPPGVPHARQPMSRRVVDADQAVREARADRLHLAGVLGVDRRQRHAARHDDARAGRAMPASASIVAGSPLSQVAIPMTPERARQRPDQPPHRHRRVVAVRQAVEHARRPLRAAVARIADSRRRTARRRRRAASRPPRARAGRSPSGRCGSRARPACRPRRAARPAC